MFFIRLTTTNDDGCRMSFVPPSWNVSVELAHFSRSRGSIKTCLHNSTPAYEVIYAIYKKKRTRSVALLTT